MGPGVYAARYRHRVSARLLPRPTRRIAHYWDRDGTAPLPYVSDPAEYLHSLFATPSLANGFGAYIAQRLGIADPDERLRGADADPNPDRAAGASEQDGGTDRGGERAGDGESPATDVPGIVHADTPWGRITWDLYLADANAYAGALTHEFPALRDPDPRGDVPTDVGED